MVQSLQHPTSTQTQINRHAARSTVERIVELAEHLADRDRLLIEQVYRHGLSAAEVARLLGVSPRRVQRRLAKLLRRMRSPLFRAVARHHELLPAETRAVARAVVLEGRSLREAARRFGLTLHQVRSRMQIVRTYARLI